MRYLLTAQASWNEGHVHPHGGDRDTNKRKSASLMQAFEAGCPDAARREAQKRLDEFVASLPPLSDGSLSWTNNRTVTDVWLAKVLESPELTIR